MTTTASNHTSEATDIVSVPSVRVMPSVRVSAPGGGGLHLGEPPLAYLVTPQAQVRDLAEWRNVVPCGRARAPNGRGGLDRGIRGTRLQLCSDAVEDDADDRAHRGCARVERGRGDQSIRLQERFAAGCGDAQLTGHVIEHSAR